MGLENVTDSANAKWIALVLTKSTRSDTYSKL